MTEHIGTVYAVPAIICIVLIDSKYRGTGNGTGKDNRQDGQGNMDSVCAGLCICVVLN